MSPWLAFIQFVYFVQGVPKLRPLLFGALLLRRSRYYGFLFIKYQKDLLWILAKLALKMSPPAKEYFQMAAFCVLWSTSLGHPVHFIQVLEWWAGTEARRGTILPSRHLDIECWILLQTSTRHKMDAAIVATVHSYCDNATKICGAHLTFYLSSKYVSQYHLYMPAKYCYKMMKIFEWYLVIDIDKFLLSHTRHKTCNVIFIAPSWPRESCPVLP